MSTEDPLRIFGEVTDDILFDKLCKLEEKIQGIGSHMTEGEIIAILKESNALVRLFCGKNNELYSEWRYRLIKGDKGIYTVIQGKDIDVEGGGDCDICED